MTHALSHLSDGVLLRDLTALVAKDRTTTAELLAHLAEVDARKLHRHAAHASMHSYCVEELRMSEDEASRRIRAARAARDFPGILPALADGRLNLSAVVLLAPYLTPANAAELLAAAAHRSRAGVQQLLAERFPRADLATRVEPVAGPAPALALGHAPGKLGMTGPFDLKPELVSAPARMEPAGPPARVEPLSPQRYGLQVTITQETHDKLRYARSLLGHALPSGDVAQVLDRAFDALVRELERRKFAPGARSCKAGRRRSGTRYIPATVRCAVWERDEGRCTFMSERGRRCSESSRLEFDHVEPLARGGEATVGGLRLRCRAHNQLEAERVYGAGFMERKREEARQRSAERRAVIGQRGASHARDTAQAGSNAPDMAGTQATSDAEGFEHPVADAGDEVFAADVAEHPDEQDVVECLRALRIPAVAARRAATHCVARPGATLEERVGAALSFHARVRFPNARRATIGLRDSFDPPACSLGAPPPSGAATGATV